MTLGEWLNSVILETADFDEEGFDPRPRRGRHPHPLTAGPHHHPAQEPPERSVEQKLDLLATQLARLTRDEQQTAAGRYLEPESSAGAEAVAEALLARMERHEKRTAEAFSALNDRMSDIAGQLGRQPAPSEPRRPDETPGYRALEAALRNIVEHIEMSEKRNRETLRSMQDRLADLASRAQAGSGEKLAQNAAALVGLEDRLGQLAARLERVEAEGADRSSASALEERIAALSERIGKVEQGSREAAVRAAEDVLDGARVEFREIESRIHALIVDLKEASTTGSSSGEELAALHKEVAGLASRIDEIGSGPVDAEPIAAMEQRLAELTTRLDRSLQEQDDTPHFAELEERVADLDSRLQTALEAPRDDAALGEFERHITLLTEGLASAEKRFAGMATIERSIAQLFEAVEQSRGEVRETAERAANEAVERIMAERPDAAVSQRDPGPSAELKALQEGLEAVKAGAADADQKTQETLEAVHQTLEKIVLRLAHLERRTARPEEPKERGGPVAAATPEDQPAPEPQAPAPAEAEPQEEAPARMEPEQASRSDGDVPESLLNVRLPPVSSFQIGAPAKSAEKIEPRLKDVTSSAQEPAPSKEGDPGIDTVTRRDDFIAAARRAAQAAAQAPQSSGSRFNPLQRLRGRTRPNAGEEDTDEQAGSVSSKRKPLILAGAVLLLLAASTYALVTKGKSPSADVVGGRMPQVVSDDPAEPGKPLPKKGLPPVGMPSGDELTAPVDKSEAPAEADPMATGSIGGGSPTSGHRFQMPARDPDPLNGIPLFGPGAPMISTGKSGPGADAGGTVGAPPRFAAASPAVADTLPAEIGPAPLREAALGGDALAQYVVGTYYLEGVAGSADPAAALRWYQKAAGKGLALAQYRLGMMFERGTGIPQDRVSARLWYQRAAEKGNVKAMHNLAVLHAHADGAHSDLAKAARWFRAAAERGVKDSQFNLAILLERGLGVPPDLREAYLWFSIGALGGDQDAAARAAVLREKLSPEEIDTGDERARAWRAKAMDREANAVDIPSEWQIASSGRTADAGSDAAPVSQRGLIAEAQALLNELGYDAGPADGVLGSKTANALRLFQLQKGLPISGMLTAVMLDQLRSERG